MEHNQEWICYNKMEHLYKEKKCGNLITNGFGLV